MVCPFLIACRGTDSSCNGICKTRAKMWQVRQFANRLCWKSMAFGGIYNLCKFCNYFNLYVLLRNLIYWTRQSINSPPPTHTDPTLRHNISQYTQISSCWSVHIWLLQPFSTLTAPSATRIHTKGETKATFKWRLFLGSTGQAVRVPASVTEVHTASICNIQSLLTKRQYVPLEHHTLVLHAAERWTEKQAFNWTTTGRTPGTLLQKHPVPDSTLMTASKWNFINNSN